MATAHDVQIELCEQDILRLDLDVKHSIEELTTFVGTMPDLNKLCQRVRDKMSLLDKRCSDLKAFGAQQRSVDTRHTIERNHQHHVDEQQRNLANVRRATLRACKQSEDATRAGLFSGGEVRKRGGTSLDTAVKQSTYVSDSLSGLLTQMNQQVRSSEETLGVLVQSSTTLSETEQEFHGMAGAISSSGKLLSKYARRELTDKFLIALALLLYFGTVAYIVRKRLFGL